MVVNGWRHDAAGANGRWSRSERWVKAGHVQPRLRWTAKAHGRTRRSRAHGSPRRQCFCRCARDDQSRRLLCTPRNTQRHFWADAAGPTANLCVTVNEPRVRGSRRGVVQIILLASGPVVANTRPSGASGVDLVQRAGAASPVSAAARRTDPAARGMRGHGRGLRWGRLALLILGPFYVGARAISTVLRRASYARRSCALSRGRPILRVFRAQTRKFSILLRCSP